MNQSQGKTRRGTASICWMFLLMAFSVSVCIAQEVKKEIPKPPYLAELGPNAEWTAIVKAKIKRPEPQTPEDQKKEKELNYYLPQLEMVTGLKNGQSCLRIFQWQGGRQSWVYVLDSVIYQSASPNHPNNVMVLDPAEDAFDEGPNYARNDFPDLAWVGADTFVDTVSVGGVRCHFYMQKRQKSEGEITGGSAASTARQAWINTATRLPVQYDDGRNLWTFTVANGTTRKVMPPEFILKAVAVHQKDKSAK